MFPAFVNCTTINWFSEWPTEALMEVADKYLQDVSLGLDKEVINHYLNSSLMVVLYCQELLTNIFYVILTNFYNFYQIDLKFCIHVALMC